MLHVCHYQFSLYFPTSVNHKNFLKYFKTFQIFAFPPMQKLLSNFSFVYSGRSSPIFTCCHYWPICFPYSLWSLCSPTTNTLCSADLHSSAERGQPNISTPNNGKYSASFTVGQQHCEKHKSNWDQGRRPTVHWDFITELVIQTFQSFKNTF